MPDPLPASAPVILLMGPTGAGKTELAIQAAETLPVALINVDSALVYEGLDIGAARPSAEELARAPHRLMGFRDPARPYSAADFRADALAEIEAISTAGQPSRSARAVMRARTAGSASGSGDKPSTSALK